MAVNTKGEVPRICCFVVTRDEISLEQKSVLERIAGDISLLAAFNCTVPFTGRARELKAFAGRYVSIIKPVMISGRIDTLLYLLLYPFSYTIEA